MGAVFIRGVQYQLDPDVYQEIAMLCLYAPDEMVELEIGRIDEFGEMRGKRLVVKAGEIFPLGGSDDV